MKLANSNCCEFAILCCVLFVVYFQHPERSACTRQRHRQASEVRALWVVRTTLTSPEKIRQLVASAADNGFNTLIVQIRGRGDSYYKSKVEPRAIELKDQPLTFDPLALTLEEAHKRGLKVHGWLNTNLLANLDALPARSGSRLQQASRMACCAEAGCG